MLLDNRQTSKFFARDIYSIHAATSAADILDLYYPQSMQHGMHILGAIAMMQARYSNYIMLG
jgi:hypothetical protein